MRRALRLDPVLAGLAVAGSVLAHQIGYAATASSVVVDHRHLSAAGPLLLAAATAALWLAAVRTARRSAEPVRLRSLLSAQIVAYAVLEVAEYAVVGDLGLLWSAPVLAGLAVQPGVAALAVALVQLGAGVVDALDHRPLDAPVVVPAVGPGSAPRLVPAVALPPATSRGPPVVI